MAISFSKTQFTQFDAAAFKQFETELRQHMIVSYPDVPKDEVHQRVRRNLDDCAGLGIESEHALYAYNILCFEIDAPLSQDQDFLAAHSDYLRKYRSADRLPIDLLDMHGNLGRCLKSKKNLECSHKKNYAASSPQKPDPEKAGMQEKL